MSTFNFDEKLDFKNIREPKILKLKKLQDDALRRAKLAKMPTNVVLACALKFSISGSNIERMVPIKYENIEYDKNFVVNSFKFFRGPNAKEDQLTVSRFCASFANEIRTYLSKHPDDVRTVVDSVNAELSFPHNYYCDNLSRQERDQCIVWLTEHDKIMNQVLDGKWRPLAIKALAYFKKAYADQN